MNVLQMGKTDSILQPKNANPSKRLIDEAAPPGSEAVSNADLIRSLPSSGREVGVTGNMTHEDELGDFVLAS